MLSRKQLLKKTRSLNEKAGREKARRKQALQQKQGAVRSRLAVAGASSRAALRGELAALESSLEGETVAKLMAQLGAAKEERRTRRRATYLAKVANSDQRVPTVNPRVSHSKPWLSAMNSRNCIPMRKGYGLGPSTSSKPFGLVGKSLWPVQPARHARSLPKEAWRAFPDGRPFLEPPPVNMNLLAQHSIRLKNIARREKMQNEETVRIAANPPPPPTPWKSVPSGLIFSIPRPDAALFPKAIEPCRSP